MRISAWPSLWLLASAGGVLSQQWNDKTALTTLTPCPPAPSSIAPHPITVTSQYQPVSTCEVTSVCTKHGCSSSYSYRTYSYVSTVIPCADSSSTTVTKTDQTVTVSRSTTTITNTQAITSTVRRGWRKPITTTTTLSTHTTVVKEWSAPFQNLGPLAISGYGGSGLCKSCEGPHGEKQQIVGVVECSNADGDHPSTMCQGAVETWIYNPIPTSAKEVHAHCQSRTAVPSAGTYTFAFPRWAPPAAVPVPARTITYTDSDRTVVTKVITETVTIIPGGPWTAWITRSCAGPTIIDIDITITKTIIYVIPPFTVPCT